MSNNDALLFVGYEEDTGTVLSVAGVTLLGVRAPLDVGAMYSSKTPAGRKKFGTGSGDFERGVAAGCAAAKRSGGGGALTVPAGSRDFQNGFRAGASKCRLTLMPGEPLEIKPHEGGFIPVESLKGPTPAPISAPQPHVPGPADLANAAAPPPPHSLFDYNR